MRIPFAYKLLDLDSDGEKHFSRVWVVSDSGGAGV